MKRGIASALLLALAAASGCQSQAHYIEKQRDSGVVAVPDGTDAWPTYNRRAALELIQKHVGPNYEIIEEHQEVVGKSTRNDQQTNVEQTVNREIFFLPAEKQTTTTTTTQRDLTQWRIVYRRVDRPAPLTGDINRAGGFVNAPTSGPAAGIVPSVTPTVQPAGAVVPRGTTGTGSYTMPGARPARPTDCAD